MTSRGLASTLRLTSAQVLPPHDLPVIAGRTPSHIFQRTFCSNTVAFLEFESLPRTFVSENATLVFIGDGHTTPKVNSFCDSVVTWATHNPTLTAQI